jgi:hypothetical protein
MPFGIGVAGRFGNAAQIESEEDFDAIRHRDDLRALLRDLK